MLSTTKQEVLSATTFGQRIAEDEAEALTSYFVETHQWRKLISGEIDVIYGPKGSGKSALFALLRKRREDLRARNILAAAGENVRGALVFADLVAEPPASEDRFRDLWKLYFLSLIGTAFRLAEIDNSHSRSVVSALEGAGLVIAHWSLKRSLRAALDYIQRIDSVSGDIKVNPATGQPEGVGGKITVREPTKEQLNLGYTSADSLLEEADRGFSEAGKKFWIVLDRLDVAFAESPDFEGNALRALFRVYRDIAGLQSIALKVFLRDDVWKRITSTGFREASHVTKSITITWDKKSLLNLVIRRALHNEAVRAFYDVDSAAVLASSEAQENLFYRIFPSQVDLGERKSNTLDWMLSRTADGTGQTAPRELIHLLSAARDEQLKSLEMGAPEPEGDALFERSAMKAALPEVSKARYEQTLCAEYPALKPILDKLDGEKTQQTPATLAKIWRASHSEAVAEPSTCPKLGFSRNAGLRSSRRTGFHFYIVRL